ncbi:MAG: tripartite tricarboxylate transporter TctB family protein [Rubrivivax sp.]|nr:tripartite tricarboxylate transporter TctB family protein [Rubrivivax sp.]
MQPAPQAAVGGGVALAGLLLAVGAWEIPSAAGYAGVGPNFLPWLVAGALVLCGLALVREAFTGGFRAMEEMDHVDPPDWHGFAWVSAALLASPLLILHIGFILDCALVFALAQHGFRRSEGGSTRGWQGWLKALLLGMAISAPVFWLFTRGLDIGLPSLTQTGWI